MVEAGKTAQAAAERAEAEEAARKKVKAERVAKAAAEKAVVKEAARKKAAAEKAVVEEAARKSVEVVIPFVVPPAIETATNYNDCSHLSGKQIRAAEKLKKEKIDKEKKDRGGEKASCSSVLIVDEAAACASTSAPFERKERRSKEEEKKEKNEKKERLKVWSGPVPRPGDPDFAKWLERNDYDSRDELQAMINSRLARKE